MYLPRTELSHTVLTTLILCTLVGVSLTVMRPPTPHPGLKDEALKEALRGDWNHQELSYIAARKALWGEVDGDGRTATDAYTGKEIKYVMQPLPNTGATEHAWPLTRLPAAARSDLHHMFTVSGEARIARLNLHYGQVRVPLWSSGGSRSGPSSSLMPVFEVRKEHRGDVARAMFYVATMYKLEIPDKEEKVLRQWHKEDPVSKVELKRMGAAKKRQKSSNPFVEYPELVDRIGNF